MTAIRVELELADGSFTTGILRAGQSLAQFNQQLIRTNPQLAAIAANGGNVISSMQRMDGSTKGFLSTLRDVSIVTGLVSLGMSKLSSAANGWAGDIVRVNAEMERLTFQMKAMATTSNPLKEAGDNVKYLREQAAQMPFSLKTITSGFVKLKATGTDPMGGSLNAIADGIAAFGGTDESFNRTILGITQAAGKGVLQMEELRQQIGESMPIAMQLLARSMGLTVGQLAKEISTGTVAARPALEMLYKELDRAYGGTAQRMMQSFSGQITQLHTNMTNLATSEGGRGFFDQVKSQLVDINQFLSGDMAQKMAMTFGQGLSSIVSGLRTAVVSVWEFREELTRAGVVIAGGLGIIALTRGLSSLTAALQTSALTWGIFRTNMASAWSNLALGVSGMRSLSTVAIGAQFASMGLGQAVGAVAAGISGLAPLIVGAGMAAWAAAEYFGLLSDKTNEAYEALVKYGAESKKVAQDTISAKEKQLEDRIAAMEKAATMASPGAWDSKIAETRAELAALRASAPKFVDDAAKRESQKALESFKIQLSDLTAENQRAYREDQTNRDTAYNEDLAKTAENEQSKSELRRKYEAGTLEAQKKLSSGIIDVYDNQLKALNELLVNADADGRKSIRERMDFVNELRITEFNRLKAIDEYKFGAPKTAAGGDEKKALERGDNELERLQRDIAGIKAELSGASSAMAEMQVRIENGDFGSIKEGGAEVAKLHQELLDAAGAKEALDKVMKGNQKADQDLDKLKSDLREKELELLERQQGRDLNDAEKMRLRLDNGGYDGLGTFENIQKALSGVVGAMNAQGEAANQVGTVMRQNTFGDQTVQRVDSVTSAVKRLTDQVGSLVTGMGAADFNKFGQGISSGISGGLGAGTTAIRQFSGSLLELIAKGESGGNYNATLDNGAWTGGGKNLVGMQLKDVRDLQRMMLANPGNRAKYGNGKGSSALGKYQIVGQTLEGLMKEMGLNGSELFDEKMQDQMAMRLLNRRQGQGLEGMRNEWTSLRNVPDDVLQRALNSAGNGPTVERAAGYQNPMTNAPALAGSLAPIPQYQPTIIDNQIEKTAELRKELEETSKRYQDLGKRTSDQDLAEWITKTGTETKELGKDADDTGKRYNALVKAIASGKFDKAGNPEDRNPEAARFKDAIAAAKEYDRVEKAVNENKKLRGQTDKDLEKFEERRLELNRRIAEQQKLAANPDYKPDSQELQRLTTDLDDYAQKMLELSGGDKSATAYKQALDLRSNLLRNQNHLELTEQQAKLAKETRSNEDALLTQTQLRQREMARQLQIVDEWVEKARKSGMDEVQITETAEASKAAIRAKYAQEMSPMQKQFKEWGDLQGNLSQASAKWMDSLAGGVSDLIMGTGDLRGVIQGILKDMVNMGVKYLMSGMMGSKGGQPAAGKGGGGKKAASTVASGGKKAMFPTAHTGGVIGSGSLIPKMAHSAIFSGAPKFHTGGIVDGLMPSEVPIIAKKGEGVFTPEQMSAMGGFQQTQAFQINAPITVNGSAGTPEQNTDLASKMAKEMETSMRGLVADELRKQTKPGNFMNTRSR
jgi:tape measure domain-containing protein